MTAALAIILRPLVGAVIGYITNDIAIRMLFRPRTAKYVFGMKVPFTPGIIPKEKGRLAASIGEAISSNLMNREVLEKTLLSPEMIAKIEGAIRGYVETQKKNTESVREYLLHYLRREEIDRMEESVASDLSAQIHSALDGAGLGAKIASIVVAHVMEKVKRGMLGILGADQFLSMVASSVESLLAKNIDEMLANHSREMVETMIEDQIGKFLEMRMMDLFIGNEGRIEQARKTLISLYRSLVSEQLPRILDTINISGMVEDRINEMDVRETERLMLGVMKKELKAIVWLGAFLGFLIGWITLFT